MKAIILAGGLGSRISEESHLKPKPMIEIGGKPIIWHIMKIYSKYGVNDFIICLGYKGYIIKEYFSNYFLHLSDVTFNMRDNSIQIHQKYSEPWTVTLLETGDNTMTGGRIKKAKKYIDKETFCMTYGDGLADINIYELIDFHRSSKTIATVTAIQPPGRYGAVEIQEGVVRKFQEKPAGDGSWINGGFFVLEPEIFDMIDHDETVWENEPLRLMVEKRQLSAYKHNGFWQAMDTLREKNYLEELWANGNAPWKLW